MEIRPGFWQRLIIFLLLWLAVGTLHSFTHYLARLHSLATRQQHLQIEATQLARTQQAWQEALATATSEAAVAAWAHENGMAVPGEELVVPLPAGTPLPPGQKAPADVPEQPVWQLWWALFFGQAP